MRIRTDLRTDVVRTDVVRTDVVRTDLRRLRRLAALLFALPGVAVLAACGATGGAQGGQDPAAIPSASVDVVSAVHRSAAAAALLPADVRAAGVLKVAASVAAPPGAYYPNGGNGRPVGQDIDFTDAVAKVLGLRAQRQIATFDTILPGLADGKYQVGTGNFGVTDVRRRTVDFVTYIQDGQGFAVKSGSGLGPFTRITQLCGLTVGTGAGTTFAQTLQQDADQCAEAGRRPYTVKVFSDQSAELLGLQEGRYDVLMSTINGLTYQAKATSGAITFAGRFHRLDVGFAFAKGSPLTRAVQSAVNELIKDGTYRRILEKWGTTGSAIAQSQISPPELKN